jgi:undecaprenyl diphosphate synthase
MRDVDMFLRSSGEQRTSNFLPWQSSYAEFVFMDVLWPDMTPKMFWKAIEIYSERERRFGSA